MKCKWLICTALTIFGIQMFVNTSFAKSRTGLLEMKSTKESSCLVIDRIEGNISVCEDKQNGRIVEIKTKEITGKPKDGDYIKLSESGKYTISYSKTEKEKAKLKSRIRKITNKIPKRLKFI